MRKNFKSYKYLLYDNDELTLKHISKDNKVHEVPFEFEDIPKSTNKKSHCMTKIGSNDQFGCGEYTTDMHSIYGMEHQFKLNSESDEYKLPDYEMSESFKITDDFADLSPLSSINETFHLDLIDNNYQFPNTVDNIVEPLIETN